MYIEVCGYLLKSLLDTGFEFWFGGMFDLIDFEKILFIQSYFQIVKMFFGATSLNGFIWGGYSQ